LEQLRGSNLHDFDDGMRLCATADLTGVGDLANLARERISADRTCFVRNFHTNYANSCDSAARRS